MVTIMGLGQKTGTRHIANDTFLTSKQKDNVAQDVETLLHLGRTISNAIVYEYKDFIAKFTKKYSPIFGTGECTIPIEQFVKELEEWRAKQTDEKRAELDELEKIILEDLNTYKSSCYKV